eukprot:6182873-Alexandrium_andersonii.AAC.1
MRGLRFGGSRIVACDIAISRPRTHSRPVSVGRFGICAESGAECTLRELRGSILRPLLGPRSS